MPSRWSKCIARYPTLCSMGVSLAVHLLAIGGLAGAAYLWIEGVEPPQFGTRRGRMSVQLASIPAMPKMAPEFFQLVPASLSVPKPPWELTPTAQPIERQRQRYTPVVHKTALDLPAAKPNTSSQSETKSEAETKPAPLDKPLLAKTAPQKMPPLAAEPAKNDQPGPRRKASPGQMGSLGSTGSGEYEIAGLHIIKPRYPDELRPYKLSGTVLLELTIGADGWVKHVRIMRRSTHPTFDRLALEHARLWRGTPGRRNGSPIQTIELQEVVFPAPL
jgi:TonB family protein